MPIPRVILRPLATQCVSQYPSGTIKRFRWCLWVTPNQAFAVLESLARKSSKSIAVAAAASLVRNRYFETFLNLRKRSFSSRLIVPNGTPLQWQLYPQIFRFHGDIKGIEQKVWAIEQWILRRIKNISNLTAKICGPQSCFKEPTNLGMFTIFSAEMIGILKALKYINNLSNG